jgi:hypothetical protein
MRLRHKSCQQCQQQQPVLYRVKHSPQADWQFVCLACLPKLKQANPDYRYGGTWKSRKA